MTNRQMGMRAVIVEPTTMRTSLQPDRTSEHSRRARLGEIGHVPFCSMINAPRYPRKHEQTCQKRRPAESQSVHLQVLTSNRALLNSIEQSSRADRRFWQLSEQHGHGTRRLTALGSPRARLLMASRA
jgi:hypothetical protein